MKLYDTSEYVKRENPIPAEKFREEILTESDNAKRLAGIFVILPPGEQVPYHYHETRESVIYLISGEGIEKVEDEEFPVKAGDILFIPAIERHTIINRSNQELRYLEYYAPIERDFIEVDE
ncbi:cupin domain-containing protein [Thermodesulfobacteriota bacterium]